MGRLEPGRHPKCDPRIRVTHQTTDHRTQSEADTKCSADHTESPSALLFWNNIGNVSHRCRDTRSGDSGNDAADEEPADCRRKRHHDVIETEAETREQ